MVNLIIQPLRAFRRTWVGVRSLVIGLWSSVIRDHRCSLCSLIAVFSDLPRGSRGGPRVFVGSSLKSLEDSDRVHGDCLRVPGGVREIHKIVLALLGQLVDVFTSSMTSQEACKTTNPLISRGSWPPVTNVSRMVAPSDECLEDRGSQ